MLSTTPFGVYLDGMLEKRKKSGYCYKVGSKYCCGVGFSDDLFLLTPICIEKYCKQFLE